MTKLEFEELQRQFASSGMTLKSFLKATGVAYSTFNYWSMKTKTEAVPMPIAPITLHHGQCPKQENGDKGRTPHKEDNIEPVNRYYMRFVNKALKYNQNVRNNSKK